MIKILSLLALAGLLTACSALPKGEAKYPTGADRASTGGNNNIYDKPQGLFGDGGLKILDSARSKAPASGINVNALLWRASLDTISFMPITSADPFGGTIITDWYANTGAPDERFKANVLILGRELRADGVRVTMFRQIKKGNTWSDADMDPAVARQIEDTILIRARELRIQSQAANAKK